MLNLCTSTLKMEVAISSDTLVSTYKISITTQTPDSMYDTKSRKLFLIIYHNIIWTICSDVGICAKIVFSHTYHHDACFHDKYLVRVHDCIQSVGYCQYCALVKFCSDSSLDQGICSKIESNVQLVLFMCMLHDTYTGNDCFIEGLIRVY
jgi:hypothetical protein